MVSLARSMIFILIPSICACSPLQQAPLVYSSKVSVGVDVSGTTTEQPGLSLNVGYKQIDAAYVPVVVAKPCDLDKSENKNGSAKMLANCTNPIYGLVPVAGDNVVKDSRDDDLNVEKARQSILQFQTLSTLREGAIKAKEDATLKLTDYENTLKKFKNDNKLEASAKPEDEALKDPSLATIREELRTKINQLATYESAKSVAELNWQNAETNFKAVDTVELLKAVNLAGLGNTKKDAYSVFGSFDANTKAGGEVKDSAKGEVALALGKVFSTGVASQNLTEGMRRYYVGGGEALVEEAKSPASCLVKGLHYINVFSSKLDLKDPDEKKRVNKMYEIILDLCKQQSGSLASSR